MLVRLGIRDIVLIDRLDVEVAAGLTVLTGETGAGKSILLDGLNLAIGGRADAALVRRGAEQAVASAVFEVAPDHPARALARDHEVDVADELVLRRRLGRDGRSRAFINDQPVSVGLLRAIGAELVEVHGQHDVRGLLDPASHRALLDDYGGLDARCAEVARRHGELAAALEARAALAASLAADDREREYLEHTMRDLRELDPQAGESAALRERRDLLRAADKIADALGEAFDDLVADPPIDQRLHRAARRLERGAANRLELDRVLAALDASAQHLLDAIDELERLRAAVGAEAGELERIEDRWFALQDAARKHRIDADALPALLADVEAKLSRLGDRQQELAALTTRLEGLREGFAKAVARLSRDRAKAAARLDKAIARELAPLGLPRARFETQIAPQPRERWSANGGERIAFAVSTLAGSPPGPINRIASGGELSRLMLAIRAVASRQGAATTLIFDEIDQGVGGAIADSVGRRLARLAGDKQVLVVTHSPQLAARAGRHWRIAKHTEGAAGASARTEVAVLDAAARREELARMLAGAEITSAARAAADSLIEAAGA